MEATQKVVTMFTVGQLVRFEAPSFYEGEAGITVSLLAKVSRIFSANQIEIEFLQAYGAAYRVGDTQPVSLDCGPCTITAIEEAAA